MSVKSFISRYLTVFRIIAAIIAFALIGVLLWGANDLLGNPISYSIAKKNAQKYIAEKYAADGYVLEGVSYSFKFKDYLAHVAKNNSEDCRFTVFFGMDGSFRGDNYESLVQNGSNIRTVYRIISRSLAFLNGITPQRQLLGYSQPVSVADNSIHLITGSFVINIKSRYLQ